MSAVLMPGRAAAFADRTREQSHAVAESSSIDANRVWEIDRTMMLDAGEFPKVFEIEHAAREE